MTPLAVTDSTANLHPRPVATSLLLIGITVIAGLSIRFVPMGLPAPVVKFGGSALWAVMVYWTCSTLLPRLRLRWGVIVSALIATAVEFLKLYYVPWLDAFRHTLPGIILLGRIFNPLDIAVYWIAIAIAACLDAWLRRRPLRLHPGSSPPSRP